MNRLNEGRWYCWNFWISASPWLYWIFKHIVQLQNETSQLTYTAEVNWKKLSREYFSALKLDKKLSSNPCGLDNSTGRVADQYPKGASSNPAWVNIFQLTSAV